MIDYYNLLRECGYAPRDEGDYYRMPAVYRGGNNPTSLIVWKNNGRFIDFVSDEKGSFSKLIALTLKIPLEEAEKKVGEGSSDEVFEVKEEYQIMPEVVFNKEQIEVFLPIYNFYNKRGVSTETLKFFKSGYCSKGKLSDRYVFPIFDENGRIVGLAGRDMLGHRDNKWKLLGHKRNWNYPYFFNKECLESAKEVILVESIGDMLALWEVGIKNTLVLFGKVLFPTNLKIVLGINPDKVIIATNNDFDDEKGVNHGLIAAQKIKTGLEKFFSVKKIEIRVPQKNDFGEMTKQEIIDWKNE